ncbi:MAG TPA: hypothetical protein VGR26_14890 [Acidimicrobiales bacterium]|nr:hypothetical protein [Acidimicrobiales bacterium]
MSVKCHVVFDLPMGGLRLHFVSDEWPGAVRRGVVDGDGSIQWVEADLPASQPATLTLRQQETEALLEGVLAYTRSRDGYVPTEARKDYLAERERVDKLLGVLSEIARDPR